MSDQTRSPRHGWMLRERWNALVRGDGCPLCADIENAEPSNPFTFLVADLGVGHLRLARNQHLPGYCVLIARQHVREPHELTAPDRAAFFEEMVRAGAALERVFEAIKINYQILGNAIPHLHCHITPRFYGDPYPGRAPETDPEVLLSTEEYEQRIMLIRAALR